MVSFFRSINMPPPALKMAQRELTRLKKMSPQTPEYPMLRYYVEMLAELPWDSKTEENIDLTEAQRVSERNKTVFLSFSC